MVKASKAKQDYITQYDKANYDRILVRLPKGTKDRIQSISPSVNGYIVKLVLDNLNQVPPLPINQDK